MRGLTIYKASAGSGKTYTLTLEYLRHALSDPYNTSLFQGMLAVTFTNKATEEMKSRILLTLHQLAEGYNAGIGKQLLHELGIAPHELKQRAERVQAAILHNYSRFSISTIDKFFQKIIHAFVREAGLRPGFKLELDQTRLLEEAIDRLMTGLYDKPLAYEWVMRTVDERVERGVAWDVRRPLQEKGNLVFSETFREFGPEFYSMIADKAFMQNYLNQMQAIVKKMDTAMKDLANMALADMREVGVEVTDFPYGKSSFASYLNKVLRGDYEPGARVLQALYNPDQWVNKGMSPSTRYSIEGLFPMLNSQLVQLVETYKAGILNYNTAKAILNNFRLLGLLAEIETQVRAVANDDNLMPISETTYLLGKLIDGSETPFVYERTGNRYHTYMIDEFQDTSAAQWRNFKPLLSNSLSQGQFCMVVGDVKQSIYRWRNGDWRILAHQLTDDFRQFECRKKTLETNWRSKPVVVGFNNTLFTQLPTFLANGLAAECEEDNAGLLVTEAYDAAAQTIPLNAIANGGYVGITAYYATEEQKAVEQILDRLPELMIELQDRGYAANDIAILVRRAEEGQWVSDCLLEHKRKLVGTKYCLDIVSQDTLFIARSQAVQLSIGLLRALNIPTDEVNNAFINNTLCKYYECADEDAKAAHHAFSTVLRPDVAQFLSGLSQLSLSEMFERIVGHYGLAATADDLPFVQELHDELLQFSCNGLADVSAFLHWWDEHSTKLKLTPSKAPRAINILTIHKSKGLQFPVVVVPFCNWSLKPHADTTIWVSPKEEPFNQLPHVPVVYGTTLRNSHFNEEYVQETIQSVVDNANVLYVALTRPEEELHVMLPLSKTDQEGTAKQANIQNVAQSLHSMIGWDRRDGVFEYAGLRGEKKADTIHFGKPQHKQQTRQVQANDLVMRNYPVGEFRGKLLVRYESDNYFPDTLTTPLQYRNYGTLMHRVFANITTPADIGTAVGKLVEEGWLDETSRPALEDKVRKALQQPMAAPWFNGSWQVRSEQFLLLPPKLQARYGLSRRPDRVMMNANETVVIDYKFGTQQQASHSEQVNTYVRMMEEMGYPNVCGYVWYVDMEKIVKTIRN